MPSNNDIFKKFAPLVGQSWSFRVIVLHKKVFNDVKLNKLQKRGKIQNLKFNFFMTVTKILKTTNLFHIIGDEA